MLKIGELAQCSNVSKRTIDYYTKLGLLNVDSISPTGYRFYSETCIEQLTLIHYYKQQHLHLDEIRERLHRLQHVCNGNPTLKLEQIQQKLEDIHLDIHEVNKLLDEKEKDYLRQTITTLLSYL